MQWFRVCIFYTCVFGVTYADELSLPKVVAGHSQDIRAIGDTTKRMRLYIEELERNCATLKREISSLRNEMSQLKNAQRRIESDVVARCDQILSELQKPQPIAQAPRKEPAIDPNQSGFMYTIEPGDVLGQIAIDYKSSTEKIMQANTITDPTKIRVGQTLFIPTNL